MRPKKVEKWEKIGSTINTINWCLRREPESIIQRSVEISYKWLYVSGRGDIKLIYIFK